MVKNTGWWCANTFPDFLLHRKHGWKLSGNFHLNSSCPWHVYGGPWTCWNVFSPNNLGLNHGLEPQLTRTNKGEICIGEIILDSSYLHAKIMKSSTGRKYIILMRLCIRKNSEIKILLTAYYLQSNSIINHHYARFSENWFDL